MEHTDSHIIAQVLAGHTHHFDTLVERYSRQIFALVVRIADSPEDAEEITHDVFIKAFRHLVRFNGTSSFATWLYRIAYNTAISATRRHRPEILFYDEQLAAISETGIDDALDDPTEQRIALLHQALDMLPPDDKALVTLYYMEDHPISEIASIIGLTVSNVKIRLMRTRKKLYLLMTRLDET